MSYIDPANDLARRSLQQWVLTAAGASGMMAGLALFFFVEPQSPVLVAISAVLFTIGVVVGVFALYRATRLIGEGGPVRNLGLISVLILVGDPLLITVLGILL